MQLSSPKLDQALRNMIQEDARFLGLRRISKVKKDSLDFDDSFQKFMARQGKSSGNRREGEQHGSTIKRAQSQRDQTR